MKKAKVVADTTVVGAVKEKGKRGRPKKSESTEDVSNSFIEDASIKPYKIRIGERSYDVIKGDEQQPESYQIKLASALEYIARQKTSKNKTVSIAEYVAELKANQTLIAAAIAVVER